MSNVSTRQVILMGALFILVSSLISMPAQVLRIAKQDAWLAVPIVMLCAFLSLFITTTIQKRFPNETLLEILTKYVPFVGKPIAFLYIVFFGIVLARDLRLLTDFVKVALLPLTPAIVIMGLTTVTVIVAATSGIEVLGRMTELFFPVFIAVFIIVAAILLRDADFKYVQPFFEYGMMRPVLGSWFVWGFLAEVIIMPLLFPNPSLKWRTGFYSILIGGMMLEGILLLATLTLSGDVAGRLMYPSYELVRQVKVTDFLDRFDLLVVSIWMPTIFIKLAMDLYLVCNGLQLTFPALSAKHTTTPIGVFSIVTASWLFRNSLDVMRMNRSWAAVATIVSLLIPLAMWGLFVIRKTTGRGRMAKE